MCHYESRKPVCGKMKAIVSFLALCAVGVVAATIWGWREVGKLRANNEALRQKLAAVETDSQERAEALRAQHREEMQNLQREAQEVHKLRGEVNRLRSGADSLAQLQKAQSRLKRENQTLREAARKAAVRPTRATFERGNFPKEGWEFLGYESPEDALVSAIWTMQQGDPQGYFESLAPAEQERMAQRWQDKTEEEIANKHQSDVAAISGIRVLNRRDISDQEVVLDVYIEGTGRMQTVSMQRIDNQWKFAGEVPEKTP